ncbi:MAG: diguanylate cyclase [Sulfuricaulis sp.]|uniref:diguanylate cyclase n=1 Tax=Sulfuricaulis sp. TaxID=2003553 RepID=UPI0025FCD3FF|nr:diguanylate cyclase [Sulfuricaulis sp.]MCR4347348.1 diguanylate cyclase [Sulfuricaulis sp.]
MPRLPQLSLRQRYILGLCAVLLPFLIAIAVAQLYVLPRLIESLEKTVTEVLEELGPVMRVRIALLRVSKPPNKYLLIGDPAERSHFEQLSHEMDLHFNHMLAVPFGLEQERTLAKAAQQEWRQARRLAEDILRAPPQVGNPELMHDVKRLDAHIDRAVALLDQLHNIIYGEIKEALPNAHAARQHTVLIPLISFIAAFIVSLIASLLLARPMLKSISALGGAASRLAGGDFSARAVPGRKDDEIGQLALAFNVMAEKIEQHQKKLEELAIQDSLTELLNRRGFYRWLTAEMERSRRYNHPFSLLMLDIDDFKIINDTYGHQAGDEAIRVIASRIRRQVRPVDRVARYGGEEFAVILPETTAAGALSTSERIRASVAGAAILLAPEQGLNLTISIGMATFPEDADTDDGIIAAADQALYSAKEAGRNRVCRYTRRNVNG